MITRSVTRRLTIWVVGLQIGTVVLLGLMLSIFIFKTLSNAEAAGLALERLSQHVQRLPDGSLALDAEGEAILSSMPPSFWLHVADTQSALTKGSVPAHIQPFLKDAVPLIRDIGSAFEAETPAGTVSLAAGATQLKLSDFLPLVSTMFGSPLFYLLLPNVVLTLLVVPWLMNRMMMPITDVTAAALRIQAGKRGQRLPQDRAPTEVEPLIKAVNDALERLDEWTQKMNRFIADASHELRTPITVLQVRLDALPPGRLRDELQRDCRRLAMLANQLLEIERIRSTEIPLAQIDLVKLTRAAVEEFALLATRKGANLGLESDAASIPIRGDGELIIACLTNLLENALRHGGRSILVRVGHYSGATIEVIDSGPGVRPDLAERIFDPFVGTPGGGGAGLGLALVQETVKAHGGTVLYERTADSQTCFRLEFPRAGLPAQD